MRKTIRKIIEFLMIQSLKVSRKKNRYEDIINRLEDILPSLKDQTNYLNDDDVEDSLYIQLKTRNQQAFQIKYTLEKIDEYKKENSDDFISLVDIGDSSGNHLIQLQALNKNINSVASVNLDKKAVEKIRKKGIEAYHCRAEELLEKYDLRPNFFISYQMLEHLTDPVRFLHSIANSNINNISVCDRFIISVPYRKKSTVGLSYVRSRNQQVMQNAESVHIFELSPTDWKLLAEFSGWEVISDKIYYQYPKWHWLYFTKYLWKRFDYEGFYIMELKINNKWSKLYESW